MSHTPILNPQDRRLFPARSDLAARHLQGQVEAERFADKVTHQVTEPVTSLFPRPDQTSSIDTQLMAGELFDVYDIDEDEGWVWGQSPADDYVGFVRLEDLSTTIEDVDHRVSVLRTIVFSQADLKSAPVVQLSLNSRVKVEETSGDYARLSTGGWVVAHHLAEVNWSASDFVSVAELHLNAPYQWGGKESLGLDCSGLVQSAMIAAGFKPLRDADMQEATIGQPIDFGTDLSGLQRGDLVFWPGHVGIMLDQTRMIHANAHHMRVVSEPLTEAAARILAKTKQAIRTIKRPVALSVERAIT